MNYRSSIARKSALIWRLPQGLRNILSDANENDALYSLRISELEYRADNPREAKSTLRDYDYNNPIPNKIIALLYMIKNRNKMDKIFLSQCASDAALLDWSVSANNAEYIRFALYATCFEDLVIHHVDDRWNRLMLGANCESYKILLEATKHTCECDGSDQNTARIILVQRRDIRNYNLLKSFDTESVSKELDIRSQDLCDENRCVELVDLIRNMPEYSFAFPKVLKHIIRSDTISKGYKSVILEMIVNSDMKKKAMPIKYMREMINDKFCVSLVHALLKTYAAARSEIYMNACKKKEVIGMYVRYASRKELEELHHEIGINCVTPEYYRAHHENVGLHYVELLIDSGFSHCVKENIYAHVRRYMKLWGLDCISVFEKKNLTISKESAKEVLDAIIFSPEEKVLRVAYWIARMHPDLIDERVKVVAAARGSLDQLKYIFPNAESFKEIKRKHEKSLDFIKYRMSIDETYWDEMRDIGGYAAMKHDNAEVLEYIVSNAKGKDCHLLELLYMVARVHIYPKACAYFERILGEDINLNFLFNHGKRGVFKELEKSIVSYYNKKK